MAYTYLIGWSKHQKYYYGVRFAKNSTPQELWKTYFTSSKHVAEFRTQFGEPDIIQIRKTFSSASQARLWETKVLTRMKVVNNSQWLNKTDNMSIDPELAKSGARKQKGKPKSEEHKEKIRNSLAGRPLSKETRYKIAQYWHSLSEEQKKAINEQKSKSMKGKLVGEKNPMFGRKGKDHHGYGIRKFGADNPMFGKKHSEETRRKMSASKTKNNERII